MISFLRGQRNLIKVFHKDASTALYHKNSIENFFGLFQAMSIDLEKSLFVVIQSQFSMSKIIWIFLKNVAISIKQSWQLQSQKYLLIKIMAPNRDFSKSIYIDQKKLSMFFFVIGTVLALLKPVQKGFMFSYIFSKTKFELENSLLVCA